MIYLCHLATEQIAQHSDVHLWGQVQGLLEGSLLCLMKNLYNDLDKTMFILKDLVYNMTFVEVPKLKFLNRIHLVESYTENMLNKNFIY